LSRLPTVTKKATAANVGLTVITGLAVVFGAFIGRSHRPAPGDVVDVGVFSLIWVYVLLTPVLAAWVIFAARHESRRAMVRINTVLFVVWGACLAYFATLTM
jgi:multisubunit Na+/H+ antiporter MnhG subunit